MLQNQPLPVTVEHILAAYAREPHADTGRQWLEKHMCFRIMTQRFKMAHTLNRMRDRLLI